MRKGKQKIRNDGKVCASYKKEGMLQAHRKEAHKKKRRTTLALRQAIVRLSLIYRKYKTFFQLSFLFLTFFSVLFVFVARDAFAVMPHSNRKAWSVKDEDSNSADGARTVHVTDVVHLEQVAEIGANHLAQCASCLFFHNITLSFNDTIFMCIPSGASSHPRFSLLLKF